MSLYFSSFASGSSGNCYMIKSESTIILVDVGIAGKHILSGLSRHGFKAKDIDGILVTHEHVDHVRSIRMLGKKSENANIYSSGGTFEQIADRISEERTVIVSADENFTIGDMEILPFDLSHDAAEPLGYSVKCDGRQITIITDTGCVSDEMLEKMVESDLLVLEANNEVNILRMGSYPFSLKQRILGNEGHLSNETAANALCHVLKELKGRKVPKVMLAHLSRENNTPQHAFLTINNMLFEEDFMEGKDYEMSVIPRNEVSDLIEI